MINNMPTLSIIIPVRNEERIIGRTLKHLHDDLTAIDREIIVSDDKSTDRTVEIAKQYANVIPHVFEGRSTIGANRNNGARYATGDYLVFTDADMTIPDPNAFFKKLISEFEKDKKMVGATVKIKIRPDEATLADDVMLEIMGFMQWFHNNLMRAGSASGEFQMIRREAFQEMHGYREDLPVGEDNDLFMRLSGIGKTKMIWSLTAYTENRRAREMGWPKLLWTWTLNYFSVLLFNRSYTKEWKRTDGKH